MRTENLKTLTALLLLAALVPAAFGQSTCFTCINCPTLVGQTATLCAAGAVGCFRSEAADGSVSRGCASALDAGTLAACQSGTGNCRLCTADSCNAKEDFQRCHTCDSANLAQDCPQLQSANVNNHVCMDYMDECGIQMESGRTIRGCVNEMAFPATCNALTCMSCEGNFCNGIVFPGNRLLCNECGGTTDRCLNEIVGVVPGLRRVCNNYVTSNDQCFTTLTSNNVVYRGCLSDTGVGVETCALGNCVTCFQTGCNSMAARWTPELSCVNCDATDVHCSWGFAAADATACTANVFLGQTETCFQRSHENGTALRGCTLDQPTNACTEAAGDDCRTCNRSGCNRQSFNSHRCFQCRSSNNESCRDRVKEDLEVQTCPGNEQQLADQGCYTLVQDNGHVVRGCMRYMDAELLDECRRGIGCELCDEDGCNHQPAGATALKAISLALLAIIAVFVNIF